MKNESVTKIIKNAKVASKMWDEFLISINDAETFKECFHLRPTSKGITVVSTLPYAPMRGTEETENGVLTTLNDLHENLPELLNDDQEASLATLNQIGFKKRSNSNALEENMQAQLIQGLIKNEPVYNSIQFVASEFNLEKWHRFDVVGIKNKTIYIFELKKERTTLAPSQLRGYINHFNTHKKSFESVLNVYPGATIDTIDEVKGIVIMPWSANSKTDWGKYKKENDVDIWFSNHFLSFIK